MTETFSRVLGTSPRCEMVRDFARLEELGEEWQELWQRDEQGEVFQSFRWNRAWWQAFRGGVELCTPVMFEGSQLIGILPLVRRAGRVEFLGAPQADYADVVCVEEDSVRVLTTAFAALQLDAGWTEGILDGIAAHSRIARHFGELPEPCRRELQFTPAGNCYTILLGDEGSAVLDGLARKQHLRRRQNKLEKTGKVVFRHLEERSEALRHLELFFLNQRRRRAVQGKSSASEDVGFQQLLRNLVGEFDLRDELHFGVLELDGHPLAWHMSFEANQKLVFYQQTFDVGAWDLAPGEALLRFLLLFAKDRVSREFDFTRGDEPFKARFANFERPVYTLYVQRRGAAGRLRGMVRVCGARAQAVTAKVQKAAKSEKAIFERWRSARTWLQEHAARVSAGRGATLADVGKLILQRQCVRVLETDIAAHVPAVTSAELGLVSEGSLSDLVDFATAHPDVILPTEILGLRERVKNRDRLLILREHGEVAQVAWASVRSVPELFGMPAERAATFGPALSVYECWRARPDGDASISSELIHAFAREASDLKLPLRLCLQEGPRGVFVAGLPAGFKDRGTVRWARYLGRDSRAGADDSKSETAPKS